LIHIKNKEVKILKFWSFIAFVLIGFSVGLYTSQLIPSIIGGIGVGLLSIDAIFFKGLEIKQISIIKF
jgi:hypothetical protein